MLELVNINKGLEEYRNTEAAMLVDVREKNEYARGHIPEAVNEPLSSIDRTTLSKDRPLFLYCLRGSRSKKAAGILKKLGYGQVKNIGGTSEGRAGEVYHRLDQGNLSDGRHCKNRSRMR